MDLLRLSPRDLNWIDSNENYLCCVVRPELISHYITAKTFQEASEHVTKEMESQKNIEKAEQNKEGEKEKPELDYNEYVNKIQEYVLNPENKHKIKFNSSLETQTKLGESSKLEGIIY